ncbi:MAG: nitrous oxide reductase family maturation protein NosD [Limnochordaceae bacterium]|nr:nitrous oxide reductase family maturation protein NosD [Limnochordaceae bacterium]
MRRWATVACLALAALAPGFDRAGAAVLEVGSAATYPTISAALNAASSGDVIRVHPGVYRENVVIDKRVVLEGLPGAVVDGGPEGDVITIKANGVTVRGMTVVGGGHRLWRDESGIKVLGNDNVIERNTLRRVLFGIHVWGGHANVIRHNRIEGLAQLIEHDRGDGIRLYNSNGNVVEHNHIITPRDGIYVEFASHNRIASNRIERGRIGLHYMFSDDNVFEENVFVGNGVASAIMYSKRLVVRRNVFAKSYGYGAYGLFLKDADGAMVEDNLVLANETGLSLDFAVRCTLRNNFVAANEIAARILASSQDNVFVDNTFAANGEGVYLSPGNHRQRWDDGVGRGNYWSQYRGYDLDGNGVGDVPFDASEVFGHLVESYPELKLFFQSPAVAAVALAERAFPLLDRPQALDRYPVMRPRPVPRDLLDRLGASEAQQPVAWSATVSVAACVAGFGILRAGGRRRRGGRRG